jgi:hypothetical protein
MSEIAPLMSKLKSGPTGCCPKSNGIPLSIVNDPSGEPSVTFE